MEFLYLDEKTEMVKICDEAMALPSVQDLYNSDRIDSSRPFFAKVIKYIYHLYYGDHPLLKNLPFKERKQKVFELYFKGRYEAGVKDLEKNRRVVAVIKDYLFYTQVYSERKYRYLVKKIEELSEYLDVIPLTISKRVTQTVKVNVADNGGEPVMKDVQVSTTIEVDNSKEYFGAIEMLDRVMELEDKLKKKMVKEKTERELNPKSMMDMEEFE